LDNARVWDKLWNVLESGINEKLEVEMKRKYLAQEHKLKQLREQKLKNMSSNISAKQNNPLDSQAHNFYPRVVNKTNIAFSNDEMALLNRGLQYNMHCKNKNWFRNLALEADTAISMADTNDQDFLKRTIANKLKVIAHNSAFTRYNRLNFAIGKRTLLSLKDKLELNNACIASADKGKAIVVLNVIDYNEKISHFIKDNSFEKLDTDPTCGFQKQVNQAIQSIIAINNAQKWKLKSLKPNPPPPVINGLIKLHKDNNPIRPVINMRSSPSYKLSSFVTNCLGNLLGLPFLFNVKNSPQLIQDLTDLRFEPQYRLCSFDISNMYTNIPTETLPNKLLSIMEAQSVDTVYSKHILSLVQIVLRQNYFQHEKELFQQKE
jgi:hypothetical protein